MDGTADHSPVPGEQFEKRNQAEGYGPKLEDSKKDNELDISSSLTSIVTINIENFNTNKLFLETLLKHNYIVCIQEHWLYNFEKHNLETFCNERGIDCFLKCCDDADPLSPLQRPRGKGGTGILWRRTISRNVKVLPDGSDRICAILCESAEAGQVCIINVYLPCRGYKNSDDRFLDALDELR